eukprot:TRINITY_DN11051_c0_g1_i1.p1 TRINITY_DN11051_c0_g1~~TRINITY_DN11051_c0_g1_i1.p1  ORF type:complete len:124 (+),score=22.70 TRINITY_DN11051_c0_g1_i1:118-489(+)
MCEISKMPCNFPPGARGKALPRASILCLNILVILLSPFFLIYLITSSLSRCYWARSTFPFWPKIDNKFPAPLVPNLPLYITDYISFFRNPIYLASLIYFSITFWFQSIFSPSKVCHIQHLSSS